MQQQLIVTQQRSKRIYSETELVMILLLTLALIECVYETVPLVDKFGLLDSLSHATFVLSLHLLALIAIVKRSPTILLMYVAFMILVTLPSFILFVELCNSDGVQFVAKNQPVLCISLLVAIIMMSLSTGLIISYKKPLPVVTTIREI